MRREQERFYKALGNLAGAFIEVSEAWDRLNGAEDESACEEYPFRLDFDTVLRQVLNWTDTQFEKKGESENGS